LAACPKEKNMQAIKPRRDRDESILRAPDTIGNTEDVLQNVAALSISRATG